MRRYKQRASSYVETLSIFNTSNINRTDPIYNRILTNTANEFLEYVKKAKERGWLMSSYDFSQRNEVLAQLKTFLSKFLSSSEAIKLEEKRELAALVEKLEALFARFNKFEETRNVELNQDEPQNASLDSQDSDDDNCEDTGAISWMTNDLQFE